MMRFLHWILGRLILLFDAIFQPRSIVRGREEQARVDKASQGLTLYQFEACPFCVRVRRVLRRRDLNIEIRDALRVKAYRDELIAGGGLYQVPCLRISSDDGQVEWMYESSDIVRYLEERFPG